MGRHGGVDGCAGGSIGWSAYWEDYFRVKTSSMGRSFIVNTIVCLGPNILQGEKYGMAKITIG